MAHEPTRDMAEFPGSLDATFLKDLQVGPRCLDADMWWSVWTRAAASSSKTGLASRLQVRVYV